MAKVQFVGIKHLWYADVLTGDIKTPADLVALLNGASVKKVENSHQGTFQYTQEDPSVTDYIDELSGQTYYRDKESGGVKTIAFSIGAYDYATKAELQGGALSSDGSTWSSDAEDDTMVYKCIIARAKSGGFIIFPNASIVAKVDTQEKNLTLGVTATATMGAQGKDEYWTSGDKVAFDKATNKWKVV